MKKKQLPAWALCLLLIALTLAGTWRFWRPITADTGARSNRILMKVSANDKTIFLDFGSSDSYRLPRTERSEALLETGAVGREYIITSVYHHKRGSGDYHEIYSLSGVDGTIYRSIAESEADRQALLPLRIALFVTLDAVICVLLIVRQRHLSRLNAPGEEATAEEDSADEA